MLTRSSERIFNSTAILVVSVADDIPCSCNYNIRIVMSNLYSYATHLQLRQNSYATTTYATTAYRLRLSMVFRHGNHRAYTNTLPNRYNSVNALNYLQHVA